MNNTLLNIQIVSLVLLLFLIVYTIIYIRELKTCVCFKQNDKYNTNLEFLEFYQYLELFSIILLFSGLLVSSSGSTKSLFGKKGKSKTANGFFALFLLIVISITYFLIKYNVMINVYDLSNAIKDDCDCSNQWERFFLYYQGIVSGIEVVHYIIGLLVLLVVLISGFFNSLTK